MNHSRYDKNRTWRQGNLTAVLVDYENLYDLLVDHLQDDTHPDEFIIEMLEELNRYLQGRDLFQIAISNAYADFSALRGDGLFIQQSLYNQGLSPVFVSSKIDKNTSAYQLCLDVCSLLYTREDIESYVLISGNRVQLPLVQHLKSQGKNILVVTLEEVPLSERSQVPGHETFLHAVDLLSEGAIRKLGDISKTNPAARNGNYGRRLSRTSSTVQRDITYNEITDQIAYETLRVIEEHFGQYDEVYLTPLLRKLSESLDDQQNDPKSIINKLEDAGAVWLEKRRGFPYDYTVLLVDNEHPDVQQIHQDITERGGLQYGGRFHPEDQYPDESMDFEEEELFETTRHYGNHDKNNAHDDVDEVDDSNYDLENE